jgi:hypothetical protein
LHFYFDETVKNSQDKLYFDDGQTPSAFEKGLFEMLHFKSTYKKSCLTVEIEQEIGNNYQFTAKEIELIIHNVVKKPKKVKGYQYNWNQEKSTLIIKVALQNSSEKTIQIKF